MELSWQVKRYPLKKPFVITGHVFEYTDTIQVTLSDSRHQGVGEAIGTYYLNETTDSMIADLASIQGMVDARLSREMIQEILPACGARNALDCAFWDYQAKAHNQTIWDRVNLVPRELTTVFTLGMAEPQVMAEWATQASSYPHLKIKLNNDRPIERLEAIRAVRPGAKLVIDVNQGWSIHELVEYEPHCHRLGIAMIEQPLPRGADQELAGKDFNVPIGADESCLHLGEFMQIAEYYDVLNIKLDKCGGLTEGLNMVKAAQQQGMQLMVGNMTGTSLSMAPSYVIGQFCQFVDIDGPLLLAQDVPHGLNYDSDARVSIPEPKLWG